VLRMFFRHRVRLRSAMLSSLHSSIARLKARPAFSRSGWGTRAPLLPRRLVHTEAASSSAQPPPPVYKARKESSWSIALLLAGFVPIFTFGLGTWQMQRLQWKIALIDELEEKLQRDPIALPPRIK
jgi:surfeit locus 1 family protein